MCFVTCFGEWKRNQGKAVNADGMDSSPATPQAIPIDREIKIENCIDLKNYKVTKYELVSRANEVPSLPD